MREAILDEVLPPTADSRRFVEMHPNRKKYLEGVKRGESIESLYGYLNKKFLLKAVSFMQNIARRFSSKQRE